MILGALIIFSPTIEGYTQTNRQMPPPYTNLFDGTKHWFDKEIAQRSHKIGQVVKTYPYSISIHLILFFRKKSMRYLTRGTIFLKRSFGQEYHKTLIKNVSFFTSHKRTPSLRLSICLYGILRKLFLTHSFMNRF